MEKLTEEVLKTIYKRAMQYCVAKYGSEASEIELEDGYINVNFVEYHCGERDVTSYIITADCLTQDLDEVYEERKRKEEEEKKKREYERIKQQQIREERERNQRRLKYEELKKEFGV